LAELIAAELVGCVGDEAAVCLLAGDTEDLFRTTEAEPIERDLVLKRISTEGAWRGELRERRVDGMEVQTPSGLR
jgi:hypothetical protein